MISLFLYMSSNLVLRRMQFFLVVDYLVICYKLVYQFFLPRFRIKVLTTVEAPAGPIALPSPGPDMIGLFAAMIDYHSGVGTLTM
jgi:hypothetical protein